MGLGRVETTDLTLIRRLKGSKKSGKKSLGVDGQCDLPLFTPRDAANILRT